MKYQCDMVRDLLPLYHDNVCSQASKEIVEEHIEECSECKSLLEQINDNTYDGHLQEERKNIIGHYAQKVKRKSLLVGVAIAALLCIPILVCLIVNLSTGHALDWFFIVLTALLVFASLTVVPLVVEGNKGIWTLGSFTASLMLLLLTCCLYTGGNWFLVTMIPILFGLSVVFLPYVMHKIQLKGFAASNKGLIVMIVDTILLYAVIVASGLYANPVGYWGSALLITTVCLLLPWFIFVAVRYIKANGLIRAGICCVFGSVFISLNNDIIRLILEGYWEFSLSSANLLAWNMNTTDSNITLLVLLSLCIVGAILLIFGFDKAKKAK